MKRLLLVCSFFVLSLWWVTSVEATTISRLTTWTNGQVLTHSALNSEFDNFLNDYNGGISAANLAADSVASSELLEGDDYTMNNLILSTTGPDVRWNPTSGDSFHAGAEYSAGSGSKWFLSNVTDGRFYLHIQDDHTINIGHSGAGEAGQIPRLVIKTDGTGTDEVQLPASSIDGNEIASGSVDAGKMATTGTIADDKVFVADSATAATWRTIPNATGSNFLQYTQSTNSFSAASAGGAQASRVVRTAGDVTTTSTTLTDLTGASITVTTTARPVLIFFSAMVYNNTAGEFETVNIDIDGANELGTAGIRGQLGTGAVGMSIAHQSATLTAASHTVKIRWQVSSGTGTVAGNATNAYTFSIAEVI